MIIILKWFDKAHNFHYQYNSFDNLYSPKIFRCFKFYNQIQIKSSERPNRGDVRMWERGVNRGCLRVRWRAALKHLTTSTTWFLMMTYDECCHIDILSIREKLAYTSNTENSKVNWLHCHFLLNNYCRFNESNSWIDKLGR